MPFAVVEPNATAFFLVVLGLLVGLSVLFSQRFDRLGVPVVLLFIVLGMLGGSEGIGGIEFADYQFAVRIGTIYLVLILFDGGMTTSVASVRRVLLPAGLLATFGVALTAALVAAAGWLLGLPWYEALLLGSIVSSTDAAAVLAVLRGGSLKLRPPVGDTLEVESCMNDPMAMILTLTVIEIAISPGGLRWSLLLDIPLQLAIGAAAGILLGYAGRWVFAKVRPPTVGLYPALTLSAAFLSFGVATVLGGSGLLSVYLTGLVLGASPLPYRAGLGRVHDALAWLSQIGVFLMLGLLIFPSRLPEVAPIGLGVGLFLALVARPVAVALCLLPLRGPMPEIAYIGLIGLRGAVPVILGALPVLAGVPGAERVFNLVFFVVVLSAIFPGAAIRPVTRWLRLAKPDRPMPSAVLEINSAHEMNSRIASFLIESTAAACGASLSEITLPANASVMLIVRGNELLAARGATVLLPGDHVYVFFRPSDRPYVELLFGRPESE